MHIGWFALINLQMGMKNMSLTSSNLSRLSYLNLVACAAVLFLAPSAAMANDEDDKKQDRNTPIEWQTHKKVSGYKATGEERSCISLHRIQHQSILDDFTILFEMAGKTAYINQMDYRCHGLKFNDAMRVVSRTGRLCQNDFIEVFRPHGISGPTCGLDKFIELKELPKDMKPESSSK